MTDAEDQALLARLEAIVGAGQVRRDEETLEKHLKEERGLYRGDALAIVRPGSTQEVAEVVKACREAGVPIVPQSGNTSLVGGSIPFVGDRVIVLSLGRMDRIRDVDPLNFTISVDAGCILQTIQDVAKQHDRLFPLSLGAEGTCQIGGNLSTNAGGILTIRYGNARDLVLGLEVVLPDGRVWDGMRGLRKNNTGYDLKHLFIGGEGTLGIITGAVLKLFPKPKELETAWIAVRDPDASIELLARLRAASSDAVMAYELLARVCVDFSVAHIPGSVDVLDQPYDWYVLTDLASGREGGELRQTLEQVLADALEEGLVLDATIAASEAQRKEIWFIREAIVYAQAHEGGSIKHDISVPVASVPAFLERADAAVKAAMPGVRPCPFGHAGDGNIHYNLTQPIGMERDQFMARMKDMNRVVHDIVLDLDGSVSAEHGIGRMKVDEMARIKAPVELDLMRAVKAAFDPDGLMNPGKVLPAAE